MPSNQASERFDRQEPSSTQHVSQGRGLWLISCALVFVALWGAVLSDGALPTAIGRSASETRFSSANALHQMVHLMGEEDAHPVGSAANARIRERLLGVLREAGAEVEVQRAWVQNSMDPGQLALVHNVVAHFRGDGEGKEALLLSHYDSVGAGPGAADDMAGVVAWIEAVRAFRAGLRGPQKSGLWVLITEGEEDGLLGAQAFANEHRAMDRIGLVVNLEARGATGVSRLFETGLGNGPWIGMYGKHVARPSASSLSVEIYRRMPNGSDLQVFLDRGFAGLNFAFIGDWAVYHSPLDTPLRLDARSLQHHGENALAVLRGLEADPSLLRGERVARGEDTVHVDILGDYLVNYSIGLQWILVLCILAMWLFWWIRLARKGLTPGNALAAFAIGGIVVILPLALLHGALAIAAMLAGTDMVFWSRPTPAVALAVGSYFLAIALVLKLARNCPPPALRFASATGAVVWSLALAWYLPGAGFLWVPPTFYLMLSLCVLQGTWVRHMPKGWGMGWGAYAGAIVIAMLVWVPLHHGLLDAFGFQSAASLLVPVAIPSTLLLPFMWRSRRSVGLATTVAGALCLGFGLAVAGTDAPFTPEKPGTFNVTYSREFGQELARLDTFTGDFGWPRDLPPVAEAPLAVTPEVEALLPEPGMTYLGVGENGGPRYRIFSRRSARTFFLNAAALDLAGVVLQGKSYDLQGGALKLLGVPEQGIELELLFGDARDTGFIQLVDQSLGLPGPVAAWAAQAGTSWVPRHWGHLTRVETMVALVAPESMERVESGD